MDRRQAKLALSQWMRMTRKKFGKSQDDFGRELGCTGVHISQIERGRRMPSNKMLLNATGLLGCGQKEVRGLLLLRARASTDITPDDFVEVYGGVDDMYRISGVSNPGVSETQRFLTTIQNAEAMIPPEDFALLKGAVMQIIDLSKRLHDRSL